MLAPTSTKPSPRRSTRSSRGPSAGGWNCRNHVANSSRSLRLRSKTRLGPKCIVVVTSRGPKTIFERSVRPRTSGSRLRISPASRHRQDFGTSTLLSIRDPASSVRSVLLLHRLARAHRDGPPPGSATHRGMDRASLRAGERVDRELATEASPSPLFVTTPTKISGTDKPSGASQ